MSHRGNHFIRRSCLGARFRLWGPPERKRLHKHPATYRRVVGGLGLTTLLSTGLQGCSADPLSLEDAPATIEIVTAVPPFLVPGETLQLVAVGRDAAGDAIMGLTFSWTSSDPDVATVDEATGVVTALGEGMSTFAATVGVRSGSKVITVTPQTTTYTVAFDATWSAVTHPTSFPPGPHFSGLIGGTHSLEAVFWEPGTLASPGIKAMAEGGSKAPLDSEVGLAIVRGTADTLLSGGGIGLSPGRVELTFEIDVDFPLVTFVSMIAPSPDWFVGVGGLALLQDAAWVESLVIELHAYDAGTDSGQDYTSANEAADPPIPISLLTAGPFDADTPLGTFSFTRF